MLSVSICFGGRDEGGRSKLPTGFPEPGASNKSPRTRRSRLPSIVIIRGDVEVGYVK